MTDDELEERVQAIMRKPYYRVISGDPEDGYLGRIAEFDGCSTMGVTPLEAIENLEEALALWLEVAILYGDEIPEPARELVLS